VQGIDALEAGGVEDDEVRAELLLILAWAEVTIDGPAAADVTLEQLAALGLDLEHPPLRRHHLRTVESFALIADERMPEAEAALVASGEAGEAAGRPDLAYSGWANAACIAVASGQLERALAHAERGVTITGSFPAIALQTAGLCASVLALLGRHEQARVASDRQAELAARLGAPPLIALAEHDAGVFAALAGDHERAQRLLARALAGDPPIVRADARIRRAESLARLGRPDDAEAEIRAAVQEPIRAAHRPDVLVARMTFVQALVARTRGDPALAEKRLREAERHWRRLAGENLFARQHRASLVDLGRPPVTGIVNPSHELDRVAQELRGLETLADIR
jgi:tetratricopeptide (TPR) repeat protein